MRKIIINKLIESSMIKFPNELEEFLSGDESSLDLLIADIQVASHFEIELSDIKRLLIDKISTHKNK